MTVHGRHSTQLCVAAASGDVDNVSRVLDSVVGAEADLLKLVNRAAVLDDAFGQPETPIGVAARLGHLSVVKLLLISGARVDAIHFLHACRNGHMDVVRALAGIPTEAQTQSVEEKQSKADQEREDEAYAKELAESAEFRVYEAICSAEVTVDNYRTAQRVMNIWMSIVRHRKWQMQAMHFAERHMESRLLSILFSRWERHARTCVAGSQRRDMEEQLGQVLLDKVAAAEHALQVFHADVSGELQSCPNNGCLQINQDFAESWTVEAACKLADELVEQQSCQHHFDSVIGICFRRWHVHVQRSCNNRLKITLATREDELEITSATLERHVQDLNECTARYLDLQDRYESLQHEASVNQQMESLHVSCTTRASYQHCAQLLRAFMALNRHRVRARQIRSVSARALAKLMQHRLKYSFVTWSCICREEASARVNQQQQRLQQMLKEQTAQITEKDVCIQKFSRNAARLGAEIAEQQTYIAAQRTAVSVQRQAALNRALSKWIQRSLASAFEAWRRKHQQKRAATNIVRRLLRVCLMKAFVRWIEMTNEKKWMRVLMTRAMVRIGQRSKASAFHTWAEKIISARRVAAVSRTQYSHIIHRCLAMAFVRWEEMTNAQRQMTARLKKICVRFAHRCLSMAFWQWCHHVVVMTNQRAVVEKILRRMTHLAVVGAFARWSEHVWEAGRQRVVVDKILRRMTHLAVVGAFARWKESILEQQHQAHTVATTIQRMAQFSLFSSFSTWAAHVEEQSKQRQVLGKAVRRLGASALSAAFARWSEHVWEAGRQRVVVEKILRRMTHLAVVGAFARWKESILEQQRQALLMKKIVARLRRSMALSFFLRWIDCVHHFKQLRVEATNSQNVARISDLQAKVAYLEQDHGYIDAGNDSVDGKRINRAHTHRLERQLKHSLLKVKQLEQQQAMEIMNLQKEARISATSFESHLQSHRLTGVMHLKARTSLFAIRKYFVRWMTCSLRQQLLHQLLLGEKVGYYLHRLYGHAQLRRIIRMWNMIVRKTVRARANAILQHVDAFAASQAQQICLLRKALLGQISKTNLLLCKSFFVRWVAETLLTKALVREHRVVRVPPVPNIIAVVLGWKRRQYWRQRTAFTTWTTLTSKNCPTTEKSTNEERLRALVIELTSQCDRLTRAAQK
eukprot:SAG31_NODE_1380_length_8582_cov_4.390192_3_plen_1146_part_00